ncbi:MAG: hypothetical protein JXR83_19970 [Deltaproteobacteria bacterium]|nr:hypothetical protein [Deltaproteobacteria bacterium]
MVATVVIDYPEAQRIAVDLHARHGVVPAAVWPGVGLRPRTLDANTRPLPDGPFVVVNGAGHYHHETYAILEALGRRTSFAYLHLDAHPDKDTVFRWRLDCASFVGAIAEIPAVAEAVLLGLHLTPDLEDAPGLVLGNDLRYYRCDYFKKIRQYGARPSTVAEAHFRHTRADGIAARRNPSVASARSARLPQNKRKFRRGLLVRWRDLGAFDPRSIAGDQVYLSVDLDVLRGGVVTDWRRKLPAAAPARSRAGGAAGGRVADNQGDLSLAELLDLIAAIARCRRVIGADLCGLTREFAALDAARQASSLATCAAVYRALVAACGGPACLSE